MGSFPTYFVLSVIELCKTYNTNLPKSLTYKVLVSGKVNQVFLFRISIDACHACNHHYHERHSCYLDCCPAEKVGEENFKGVYEYDTELVSTLPTIKACGYNENQTFTRFCFAGHFNIPQWSTMNLTVCNTETETTKELLAIHEVK